MKTSHNPPSSFFSHSSRFPCLPSIALIFPLPLPFLLLQVFYFLPSLFWVFPYSLQGSASSGLGKKSPRTSWALQSFPQEREEVMHTLTVIILVSFTLWGDRASCLVPASIIYTPLPPNPETIQPHSHTISAQSSEDSRTVSLERSWASSSLGSGQTFFTPSQKELCRSFSER